ncbi:OLC1v1028178C1 [Oldenlandia corymbosa var. corymbosa]|uniref:DNA polymerase n=1 Tax=Oldenlandia corymbosa var. corymbosa TaxID=529605 RepID=A0AAV1CE69_OLDCO|nr:OLC1v1028178C1 [Oldenlandia corymbosa var. corymbosa]
MAPRKTTRKKTKSPPSDPQGMFSGMVVYLIDTGVQARRLEIWKHRLEQMGAILDDSFSKKVTHVFSMDFSSLLQKIDLESLPRSTTKVLSYQWLEDSLREGQKVPEESYILSLDAGGGGEQVSNIAEQTSTKPLDDDTSGADEVERQKRAKLSAQESNNAQLRNGVKTIQKDGSDSPHSVSGSESSINTLSPDTASPYLDDQKKTVTDVSSGGSLLYNPPDLNRNITEIFGKLINIYRALGDDRRSFSYYKAIPVIEKLPFKIESVEQVKHLPAIGKSMQDHIQEIVTTGKLSKLEHFETDEKVKTISLFGEVWGIGPATALKLYDKGHRTLDDLKNEESLTHAQRVGLEYFDDINTRIPRQEVVEMERLLIKAGEDILPGVGIVCGGSYRRGKSSCGDLDVVITHPDGKSHVGFLSKYVKLLKEMKFLREDLIFSVHSEEGTDSGVDTYFGLCTSPGQELRHRIDFKVYPRDIYAFGLIAWTGNDVLNRRLRLLAESKGFRLDDTGLFPATHGSGGKRGKGSASLKFQTEKEVFDFLGFPWLEPHERNL